MTHALIRKVSLVLLMAVGVLGHANSANAFSVSCTGQCFICNGKAYSYTALADHNGICHLSKPRIFKDINKDGINDNGIVRGELCDQETLDLALALGTITESLYPDCQHGGTGSTTANGGQGAGQGNGTNRPTNNPGGGPFGGGGSSSIGGIATENTGLGGGSIPVSGTGASGASGQGVPGVGTPIYPIVIHPTPAGGVPISGTSGPITTSVPSPASPTPGAPPNRPPVTSTPPVVTASPAGSTGGTGGSSSGSIPVPASTTPPIVTTTPGGTSGSTSGGPTTYPTPLPSATASTSTSIVIPPHTCSTPTFRKVTLDREACPMDLLSVQIRLDVLCHSFHQQIDPQTIKVIAACTPDNKLGKVEGVCISPPC